MTCRVSNLKRLEAEKKEKELDLELSKLSLAELYKLRDKKTEELLGSVPEDLFESVKALIEVKVSNDFAAEQQADSIKKISKAIMMELPETYKAKKAMEVNGPLDWIGSKILFWNKTAGTIIRDTGLKTGEWIAENIWGNPEGRGGAGRAKDNASNWADVIHKPLSSYWTSGYREVIWKRGVMDGLWSIESLRQAESNGAQHAGVKTMNEEVFLELNARAQGREIGSSSMVKGMADHVSKTYEQLHQIMSKTGTIKGNLPKHHIETEFKRKNVRAMIEKVGEDGVIDLLNESFQRAGSPKTEADLLSKLLFREMKNATEDNRNHTVSWDIPGTELRNRLDLSTKKNGVRVMDLLNTELFYIMDRSINRASAWSGLSKATDGVVAGPQDLAGLKALLIAEAKHKGKDVSKLSKLHDDYMDRLFGRPIRGGVSHEIRNLMQLGVYTKMGRAGVSQLGDTGQAAIKAIFNTFDEGYLNNLVMQMNAGTRSELGAEMQAITGLMNGLGEIMWHGRHLDESKLEELSKLRQISYKVSDIATGAWIHGPMGRLMGKLNFQDVIQKHQSRLIMHSWLNQTARHFTGRGSKISVERQMEVGVMDELGRDKDLEEAFKHAEFDEHGNITKLNWSKWSEKAKDKLTYGIMKTESTEVQRVMAGDVPNWMNPVIMQVLSQFKHFSIVAMNKQTRRQMRHADMEALVSLGINTAFSAMTRVSYYKAGVVGANVLAGRAAFEQIGNEAGPDTREMIKYNMLTGMAGDAMDFYDAVNGGARQSWNGLEGVGNNKAVQYIEKVPAIDVGTNMLKTVGGNTEAPLHLVMLGNVLFANLMLTQLRDKVKRGLDVQ